MEVNIGGMAPQEVLNHLSGDMAALNPDSVRAVLMYMLAQAAKDQELCQRIQADLDKISKRVDALGETVERVVQRVNDHATPSYWWREARQGQRSPAPEDPHTATDK